LVRLHLFVPCPLRRCLLFLSPQSFALSSYRALRDLHSFPTRRSSDLATGVPPWQPPWPSCAVATSSASSPRACAAAATPRSRGRSEEHTSELQSRFDLVCRLLLEKKKTSRYMQMNERPTRNRT